MAENSDVDIKLSSDVALKPQKFKVTQLAPGVPEGAATVDGQMPDHINSGVVVGSKPDALFNKHLSGKTKPTPAIARDSEGNIVGNQGTNTRSTSKIVNEDG